MNYIKFGFLFLQRFKNFQKLEMKILEIKN